MEKTSEEILEKSSELFFKYGVKSVSMDDIARELGVSKKTIYQSIKDKKDLIEQSIGYTKEKHLKKAEEIRTRGLNAIEEVLETLMMMRELFVQMNPVLEFEMRKYYPSLNRRLEEKHACRAQNALTQNMEKGISEGLFRDDFNVEVIAMVHFARITDFLQTDESTVPIPMDIAIYQIMIYHLRGICTAKGIETLEEYQKTIEDTDHDNK